MSKFPFSSGSLITPASTGDTVSNQYQSINWNLVPLGRNHDAKKQQLEVKKQQPKTTASPIYRPRLRKRRCKGPPPTSDTIISCRGSAFEGPFGLVFSLVALREISKRIKLHIYSENTLVTVPRKVSRFWVKLANMLNQEWYRLMENVLLLLSLSFPGAMTAEDPASLSVMSSLSGFVTFKHSNEKQPSALQPLKSKAMSLGLDHAFRQYLQAYHCQSTFTDSSKQELIISVDRFNNGFVNGLQCYLPLSLYPHRWRIQPVLWRTIIIGMIQSCICRLQV